MPRKRAAEGDEVQLGAGRTRRSYPRKPTLPISEELRDEIAAVAAKVDVDPKRVAVVVSKHLDACALDKVGGLYQDAIATALASPKDVI